MKRVEGKTQVNKLITNTRILVFQYSLKNLRQKLRSPQSCSVSFQQRRGRGDTDEGEKSFTHLNRLKETSRDKSAAPSLRPSPPPHLRPLKRQHLASLYFLILPDTVIIIRPRPPPHELCCSNDLHFASSQRFMDPCCNLGTPGEGGSSNVLLTVVVSAGKGGSEEDTH